MSDQLRELTAGIVGGCTATLLEYPFDTVKVRLQQHSARAHGAKALRYTTIIRTIFKEEGFRGGFYKGVSAALTASAAEHAIMFWAYRNAARWCQRCMYPDEPLVPQDEERYPSVAFGGAFCGIVASFFLTPLELVKCRMQVQNTLPEGQRHFKSALHCFTVTARRDGVSAMYRGNCAMLTREVPGCLAYFLTFQSVARGLLSPGETVQESSVWKHLVAGGLAGVAFWTALYPADVVKTRMQTQAGGGSFSSCFLGLYRKEGLRAMYRGWGITALRAFPANAVLLAVYHKVDAAWDHFVVPVDRIAPKHTSPPSLLVTVGSV
jgi:solute carrier family 25 carnitine/acylcarnitine transporter 20/29